MIQLLTDDGTANLGNTTDHPNTWARIQRWHRKCKETHKLCSQSTGANTWLPTRLLDTNIPGGNGSRVRIITTATDISPDEQSKATYLALSHCWGRQPFLILTRGNQAELAASFSTERGDLPPNFRDAIYATRQLGVRYLWIDSLGIIQGKDGEWDNEASVMDKVYMNAELCLAAAASPDAMGGFFRSRDPKPLHPFEIELSFVVSAAQHQDKRFKDPPTLERKAFRAYSMECTIASKRWRSLVVDCPLNERGWVMQGRVLAPRTVYFAKDQVYWQCKELQACEAGHDRTIRSMAPRPGSLVKNWESQGPNAIMEKRDRYSPYSYHGSSSIDKDNDNDGGKLTMAAPLFGPMAREVYQAWRAIIVQYTQCRLSHEKDKLVAVSGMAKAFARHLGQQGRESEYLAGLWRGYLLQELLWAPWSHGHKVKRGNKSLETGWLWRHKGYRAPTWSWASLEGHVDWVAPSDRLEDIAQVRSTRIESLNPSDPTAQVLHGEITLQTYLVPRTRVRKDVEVREYFNVDGEEVGISDDRLFLAMLHGLSSPQYEELWKYGLLLVEMDQDQLKARGVGNGLDGRQKFKRLGFLGFFKLGPGPIKWVMKESIKPLETKKYEWVERLKFKYLGPILALSRDVWELLVTRKNGLSSKKAACDWF